MPFRQEFGVGNCEGLWQGFGEIVMVGDEHIHAARAGIFHGRMGGDAGIAGQDEFCAAVNDLLQVGNIDPVALVLPHRDMEGDIRMQFLERLDEDGRGGLAIRIEITPDADGCMGVDGCFQTICNGSEPGQVGRRGRGVGLRIQEGTGSLGRAQAAPEQRLCHERVQVRKRSRGINRRRLDPVHGNLEFDLGNLFEIQIEFGLSRFHSGIGFIQHSGFPATVAVGTVWTVGALLFILGEREMTDGCRSR